MSDYSGLGLIEEGWRIALSDSFKQPYFAKIKKFLSEKEAQGKTVYPPRPLVFNAFNLTPFDKVKVVILGQDPYHGQGQAHGLCFSVPDGVKAPPSLMNIFKELEADLGYPVPQSGNLEKWAHQGVLLLNATLTVDAGEPNSHAKCGWQEFTDTVIRKLSEEKSGLVFLLWGNFARARKTIIDTGRHYVLEAAHPSPLSGGAFFGCRHFSKTNEILEDMGKNPVNWAL